MQRRRVVRALAILKLLVVVAAWVHYWAPPMHWQAQRQYEQWQRATEAGEWATLWAMLGPPTAKIERQSWHPNYREDQAGFVGERQSSYPGMLRQVRLEALHGMLHVDDYYTFGVFAEITYIDPQTRVVQAMQPLHFYLTKRDGRLDAWGYSTRVW